jgi:hypothetical protein
MIDYNKLFQFTSLFHLEVAHNRYSMHSSIMLMCIFAGGNSTVVEHVTADHEVEGLDPVSSGVML